MAIYVHVGSYLKRIQTVNVKNTKFLKKMGLLAAL